MRETRYQTLSGFSIYISRPQPRVILISIQIHSFVVSDPLTILAQAMSANEITKLNALLVHVKSMSLAHLYLK